MGTRAEVTDDTVLTIAVGKEIIQNSEQPLDAIGQEFFLVSINQNQKMLKISFLQY